MKVFKFGGASVKSAEAVKNVAKIIQLYPNDKIAIVVSAQVHNIESQDAHLLKSISLIVLDHA